MHKEVYCQRKVSRPTFAGFGIDSGYCSLQFHDLVGYLGGFGIDLLEFLHICDDLVPHIALFMGIC